MRECVTEGESHLCGASLEYQMLSVTLSTPTHAPDGVHGGGLRAHGTEPACHQQHHTC